MGLENMKKSLVVLDRSLDALEEVIKQREESYQALLLSKQIDMFGEDQPTQAPDFDREAVVKKLDRVIEFMSEVLKA